MLTSLLALRASPHAKSSNNANLIWQAAYFGHTTFLQILLQLNVAKDLAAISQNNEGVSYTPLHIAVLMAHESCVEQLLRAKARADVRNEERVSPLDDAIRTCQPQPVGLLVAHGAALERGDDGN